MPNYVKNRRKIKCLICKNSWKNNPKNSNTQDLHRFEYAATDRITKTLNTTKDNGTAETIEELDKLSQTI